MSSLNQKQDSLHSTFRQLHETVDVHAKRIHQLTEAHQNNATLHENTNARLAGLETEVRELRSKSRSASPVVAPRSCVGSRAPSPRSGSRIGGREEPPENPSDMAVVFGGWLDARRSEIQSEVEAVLKERKLSEYVAEISIPFVRSTFSRLLNDDMPIHEARHIQTHVVSTLKQAFWKSPIPGSQGRVLCALPNRSAEKRNRIKAIITTEEFLLSQAARVGKNVIIEFDWRGRVYCHTYQVLGHAGEESSGDGAIYHSNHTGWFIKGKEVSEVLQIPLPELHELWFQFLENDQARLGKVQEQGVQRPAVLPALILPGLPPLANLPAPAPDGAPPEALKAGPTA